MENPTKKTLKLMLNVIENRDASFGGSKELPLSGTCCCCFVIGSGTGGNGGTAPADSTAQK